MCERERRWRESELKREGAREREREREREIEGGDIVCMSLPLFPLSLPSCFSPLLSLLSLLILCIK